MSQQEEAVSARKAMTEEVKALKTSLAESRTFREDVVSAERQTEQVQYALVDKDNQLEEMSVLLARKQDEVKSLLRQLAAVGTVEAPLVCEKTEPTSFEVLFAMDGYLGLEFQQLRAPYIVAEVHQGVAAGLGIRPGDELTNVGDESVVGFPWEDLVQRLQRRPVVVRFRREARDDPLSHSVSIKSITSVGSSLLNVARNAVPVKQAETPDRLYAEIERLMTLLNARDKDVKDLEKQLKVRDDALGVLGTESGADLSAALHHASLGQQVEELTGQLQAAEARAEQCQEGQDCVKKQLVEESRLREEAQRAADRWSEQCSSLLTQFEHLRGTCESLSVEATAKAGFEEEVRELRDTHE